MTYILMVEGVETVMVPEAGVVEGVGVDGMIQTDMVMVSFLSLAIHLCSRIV